MRRRLLLAVLTATLAALPLGAATGIAGVGFATFTVRDPVAGKAMAAVVYYPAAAWSETTALGPYVVAATANLPVASGRFPVIALSPGTGGSRWDLHDWATGLARRGFIVASLDHPGDNFRDHSGLGKDTVLIGRALQISALLDAVLALPRMRAHADAGASARPAFQPAATRRCCWPGRGPISGCCASTAATTPRTRSSAPAGAWPSPGPTLSSSPTRGCGRSSPWRRWAFISTVRAWRACTCR